MPYSKKVQDAIKDIPTLSEVEVEAKAKEILNAQNIISYEIVISDVEDNECTNKFNRVLVNFKKNIQLAFSHTVEITELQISHALILGKKIIKDTLNKGGNLIHFNSENIEEDLETKFQKAEEMQNPFYTMKVLSHPNFLALVGMIMTCLEEGIPFTLNSGIAVLAFYVACQFSEKVKKYAIGKKRED